MKVSLYGSAYLLKALCPSCNIESFLIDGKLVCCGGIFIENEIKVLKRESQAESTRLSNNLKKTVLDLQDHRCYLCGCSLNESLWYRRKNKWFRLKTEFDHFIPKIFSATNHIENIYAMCSLCNRIKSTKMFDTKEAAIDYVMSIRKKDGSVDLFNDFEKKAGLK